MSKAIWDVDFSLALRNRTGKYFIGRDVIEIAGPRIAKLRYGRVVAKSPPSGLFGKLVGKLAGEEIRLHRRRPAGQLWLRPSKRVLHLDPYTAALYRVGPEDVVLCHDMGPITHPELFTPQVTALYQRAFAEILVGKPGMVFVSKASRDAFSAAYGPLPSMDVIYPPLRAELSAAVPEPIQDLPNKFLLSVGSIGARKNQLAVIRAFAVSGLAETGVGCVFCGSREPGAEEVEQAARQTPGVLLLPYVSDAQLAWLYGAAVGFVLPSKLEGFGVPVAEAIAYGLVPLVSKNTVLEEVSGSQAILVDPFSQNSIVKGLKTLASLEKAEKIRRRVALRDSINRFTPEAFSLAWQERLDRPQLQP